MATPIPRNEARFTLGEIALATSGRPEGDTVREICGVCTDSRAVEPGNLYVALRGERHDGHRFAGEALARGAAAVLVETDDGLPESTAAIVVEDSLRALGDLAAAHRKRWGGRVVGITGSAGKTTTKELVFAGLTESSPRVLRSAGNLNNAVGVPMVLFCLDERIDTAVLELGTSARGEIARLAEIARPDVGVVTSISSAHGAGIGGLEEIADEKMSLLAGLPASGTAVYLADEALMCARLDRVIARSQLSFGRDARADVRLLAHALTRELAMRCTFELRGRGKLELTLGLFGEGPALDACAALCVGLSLEGAEQIERFGRGIAKVAPPPGRLCPKHGPSGSLLIDDSYNANPASMRASIATAIELARARSGRVLLVLGDMLELGAAARAAHAEVGRAALSSEVSLFAAVGAQMRHAADIAQEVASDARHALEVWVPASPDEAAERVAARARPNDVILVKGSRGMALERVVERLERSAQSPGGGAA